MAESIKSRYKPSNPEKYQGNPNNIICRSSWERRFCVWCDKNENIISWASEEFSIPYMSPIDKRVHRYFPDYIIKVKEKNNKIKNNDLVVAVVGDGGFQMTMSELATAAIHKLPMKIIIINYIMVDSLFSKITYSYKKF